jgi:hypothetical protein
MNHSSTTLTTLLLVLATAGGLRGDSPEWPRLVSAPPTPFAGAPTGVEIEGDTLYLATRHTLAAYDLSDPGAPLFLGVSLTSGSTQRFALADGKAYLVGYHAGLNVHDLGDPSVGFPRLGGYELSGSDSLTGVGVAGDRVFVSGHGTGLVVLDASSPEQVQVVGSTAHDLGNTGYFAAEHVRVVDDFFSLAGHDDDWGALVIYRDVPGGDPEFLGDFRVFEMPGIPPTGASRRVEVKDDVAFVADSGARGERGQS